MVASEMRQPRHPTRGRLGAELSWLVGGVAFDKERDEVPDRPPFEAGIFLLFLLHSPGDSGRLNVRKPYRANAALAGRCCEDPVGSASAHRDFVCE
jgi:hypothetical protein